MLRWDLMRYVDEELSDSNSRNQNDLLSRSLAITGTAQAAYAETVSEYLSWRWPQNSAKIIQLVFETIKTGRRSNVTRDLEISFVPPFAHSQLGRCRSDWAASALGVAANRGPNRRIARTAV